MGAIPPSAILSRKGVLQAIGRGGVSHWAAKVESILKLLDLMACADTRVGDPSVGLIGCSGGELFSGIVSCDAAVIRIRIRIVRCQRPAKRQSEKGFPGPLGPGVEEAQKKSKKVEKGPKTRKKLEK